MSHFSVAVLSHHPRDVDALLAPYSECTDDPRFLDIETADIPMEEIRGKYELEKHGDESFSSFVERYYGFIYNEELDECGVLRNPNGRWDWYEIGGRWSNMLRLKPGCVGYRGKRKPFGQNAPIKKGYFDQAKLSDVEFSLDMTAFEKAERFWEVVVEGQPLRDGVTARFFHSTIEKDDYLRQYGDKHTYAMAAASFSTWALITPDGEWHEAGHMGGFASHDATKESRTAYQAKVDAALKSDPNLWITIVDCHI